MQNFITSLFCASHAFMKVSFLFDHVQRFQEDRVGASSVGILDGRGVMQLYEQTLHAHVTEMPFPQLMPTLLLSTASSLSFTIF